MRKPFKYKGRDASVVKNRAQQSGGAFDAYFNNSIPKFKPKDGKNVIRIIPPTWDDTEKYGTNWGIELWLHNSIGPDNSTYLCRNKMLGESCHLCDARSELEGDDADALRPTKRTGCMLVDRNDEPAGPQIWGMPLTLEREIQQRSLEEETGAVILIDEPEEGYDVTFIKKGSGLTTKYDSGVDIARRPSPLCDNEKRQAQWLDFAQENPVPDQLLFFDNDYLEKVFAGKISRRDEEPDGKADKEKPSHSKDHDGDKGGRPSRNRGEKDDNETDGNRSERSGRYSQDDRSAKKPSSSEDDNKETGKHSSSRKVNESDLDDMDADELAGLIKKYDLEIDPDDFPRVSKLRAEIADKLRKEKLLIEDEDDGDDEGKEENPPSKRPTSDRAKESVERLKNRHR